MHSLTLGLAGHSLSPSWLVSAWHYSEHFRAWTRFCKRDTPVAQSVSAWAWLGPERGARGRAGQRQPAARRAAVRARRLVCVGPAGGARRDGGRQRAHRQALPQLPLRCGTAADRQALHKLPLGCSSALILKPCTRCPPGAAACSAGTCCLPADAHGLELRASMPSAAELSGRRSAAAAPDIRS